MAIKSVQITLSNTVATALLVQGTTGTTFGNISSGSATSALPVLITNTDAAITIYIGGVGVTSSTGTPLLAGASIPFSLMGTGDIPYAIAASGTPKVAVMVGLQ